MSKVSKMQAMGPMGVGAQVKVQNHTRIRQMIETWHPTPWFVLHRRLFGYCWRRGTYDRGFQYQTNRRRAREALAECYAPGRPTADAQSQASPNYIIKYGGGRRAKV